MRRISIFLLSIFVTIFSFSQPPAGYYNGTEGLRGEALLNKLKEIITQGHQTLNYGDLYTYYESTDRVPGTNKVWDMYSMDGNCNAAYYYYFGQGQECGTYSGEGDCYNREHSVPQSWFNSASPMKADLFIVYPTDGYVNNRRSSYPYGMVDNPSWTSTNGSKVGTNSFPGGPNTTVFEPIDAYKGDFARTYFYVATRYKDDIPGWDFSTNLAYVFNSDGTLKDWAVQMFLQWCEIDPVSDKEIARNDSVYAIQGNRNPYIDHPEFINYIWGDSTSSSDSTIQIDTLAYESFNNCPPQGWLTFAPNGSNGWQCSTNGYMYANAYQASAASDDWLISPQINPAGYANVKLSFRTWTKFSDNGVSYPPLHVYYSTDYDGTGAPQSATWTELTWQAPDENSQTWTSSGDIDLSSVNQPFYVAFRYISSGTSANSCALWEVDNFLVKSEQVLTKTPDLKPITKLNIYPNPVHGQNLNVSLTLSKPLNVEIQLISVDGATVFTKIYKNQGAGSHFYRLPVSDFSSNILFVRIITDYGTQVRKIIRY